VKEHNPLRRIDWRELHVNYVHIRYTFVTPPISREVLGAIYLVSPNRGGEPPRRWWGFLYLFYYKIKGREIFPPL